MQDKIFYGKSTHGSEEIKAVLNQLKKSTQMGENVRSFEKKISKIMGHKYGIMVNSGSSALFLIFNHLKKRFPKNSNIITPVLTFSTTVSSMLFNGFKPNFVDVDLNTLCIDSNEIEKSINKNTVAICAPNLIGNIPDWKKIKKIAKKHNLLIIEDSADTLDAKLDKKKTGIYSDFAITSFYGSHVINCAGNGGIILCKKKKDMEAFKLLRSWGRSSSLYDENSEKIENRFNIKIDHIDYDKKFVFSEIGFNFEPSEIGATFGLEQLKKFKNFRSKRIENSKILDDLIKSIDNCFIKTEKSNRVDSPLLAYPILLNKNINRRKFQIYLEKNNIQTRVIFTGNILRQPGFKNISCIRNKDYKNADYIMQNGLLIGLHQGLSKKDLNYVGSKFKAYFSQF